MDLKINSFNNNSINNNSNTNNINSSSNSNRNSNNNNIKCSLDIQSNNSCINSNNNSDIKNTRILDYTKYLSIRNDTPAILTPIELKSFVVTKEYYQFGAGAPSPLFFPIQELKFHFQHLNESIDLDNVSLEVSQQYSSLPGFPKLIEWIRELQKRYHGLDSHDKVGKEWDILLTSGSQQGIDLVFRVFFNRGETILTERYTYGGLMAVSQPAAVNTIGVEMDDRGMIPSELGYTLKNWHSLHGDKKFPKAIYVIPHGHNPSGIICDTERKKELYEICREYDLLIIEDDPHFFLQFENPKDENGNRILVQSFLKIDSDDRVVRLDTFSKFLSSGIRVGIITCSKLLMPKFVMEETCSIFHPSGLSQSMLQALFLKWGYDGFAKHVSRVQDILLQKRNDAIENIEKHLKGLVSYTIPKSGLYVWIKLHNVECSHQFIEKYVYPKGVLFGMGISSSPDRSIKTPYIRVTFSFMEKEEGDKVFKVLADALKSLNSNNINTITMVNK